ncbi:hypothetical protein ACFL5F_04160 [Planctomycetota bacterium]
MEPVKTGQILCCDTCGVELKVVQDCDSSCICKITCCDEPMKLKENPDEDES